MNVFIKITAAEQARLDRLRATTSGLLLRALNAFLARTQSDATLRAVISLLERNDTEAVMNLIDQHVVVLGNSLPGAFADAALDEVASILRNFPDEMSVGVGFDPTQERAAALMYRNRLGFIREFGARQREVTRAALVDALRTGTGPIGAARVFRETMGLTMRMWRTVRRYRELLQSLDSAALARDLRDRRFDPTIRRAIENGATLTEDQITRMVERYRRRMEMWRSQMIARTETTKILALAREEALKQAHAAAGIPDSWIRRTWVTNLDGRERHTHHEMNGQVVRGMDSYFVSPAGPRIKYPGDPQAPASEIINCRCTVSISYDRPPVPEQPQPLRRN